MKRTIRTGCFFALTLFLLASSYIVNAFFGNPVSAFLCRRSAQQYLDAHYGHLDVSIERVFYNFKMTEYAAFVSSPSSVDTHFAVHMRMNGEVRYDTYDDVTSGWNTWSRLEEAYRAETKALFDAPDFMLKNDIAFGTLEIDTLSQSDYRPVPYGIKIEELVLDAEYDVAELAKESGHIIFYMQDEDVTFETAAQGMLRLKALLDEKGIPFFALDFVLRLPREEGKPGNGGPTINVREFLYADIYEDGMAGRVQTAHEQLEAYYAEQDALK